MNRFLLDSHIFLWWATDITQLRRDLCARLEDKSNLLYLSMASAWELHLKHAKKKLFLPAPIEEITQSIGVTLLPITLTHIRLATALPPIHSDPFDRMLIGQAMAENMTLLTRDKAIMQYPVNTLVS